METLTLVLGFSPIRESADLIEIYNAKAFVEFSIPSSSLSDAWKSSFKGLGGDVIYHMNPEIGPSIVSKLL